MCGVLNIFSATEPSELECRCGTSTWRLSCPQCPSLTSIKSSTFTRIMYTSFLLLTVIVSCIMLSPGLADKMEHLPFCKDRNTSIVEGFDCQFIGGYSAVYRLCFTVTMLFLLMSLIMIGVKASDDDRRTRIQNGCWALKYLIVVSASFGAFFIPGGTFEDVWVYFGKIGGFLFPIAQLILVADFAHSWMESLVTKYESSDSRGWYCVLRFGVLLNFVLMITATALLFTYYSASGCFWNPVFILINLILWGATTFIAIGRDDTHSRLRHLQGSIVSLYITFLTWTALSNSDADCKPKFVNVDGTKTPGMDASSVFSLIVAISCMLYSSILTSTDYQTQRSFSRGYSLQRVWNDELDIVAYPWSWFHFMLTLGSLHIMESLTNWFTPGSELGEILSHTNTRSMWIKITSSWTCALIYGWILVAPKDFMKLGLFKTISVINRGSAPENPLHNIFSRQASYGSPSTRSRDQTNPYPGRVSNIIDQEEVTVVRTWETATQPRVTTLRASRILKTTVNQPQPQGFVPTKTTSNAPAKKSAAADKPDKTFRSFLLSETLSDVSIKCGSKTFPAHRFILAAQSPVFLAMLTTNMTEARESVITMNDMSPEACREMLRFIYTGNVDPSKLSMTFAQELFNNANMYDLIALKKICEDKVTSLINVHNVVDVYIWAKIYELKNLKEISRRFITQNKKVVFESASLEKVVAECPELVKENMGI